MSALGELAQAVLDQAQRRQRQSETCRKRVYWTAEEEQLLRDRYADEDTASIAADLKRTVERVYAKAYALGLAKSEAFMEECLRRCGEQRAERGRASRFQKGQRSWNKGMKGFDAGGRSAETRFVKGTVNGRAAELLKPIGAERVTKDGILQRKVREDGPPQHRWKSVHSIMWEERNGPIPAGHVVVFRDGNTRHIEHENFELIDRAELMRRNTIHNYPPELKATMHQLRKLNKAIQEKEDEKSA